MNIYVGNLSYKTTEEALTTAFAGFGQVESVKIIKDMISGSSKGFAFVQMASAEDAQKAIDGLNGTDLDGRTIRVSQANERPATRSPRPQGGNRPYRPYGSDNNRGGGRMGGRGEY